MKKTLLMKLFITAAIILSAIGSRAADRYWVAKDAGKWSDAANWSVRSAGTGGASLPGPLDRVVFDGNTGNSLIDTAYPGTVGAVLMSAGYTGTVTQQRSLLVKSDMRILGRSKVGWTFVDNSPAELKILGNLSVAANTTITCSASSSAGFGKGRTIEVGKNAAILGIISADGKGFMKGPGTPPIPGLRKVTGNATEMVDRFVGGANAEAQAKTCPVSPAGPGHGGRGAGIYRNPNGQYTQQPHVYYWTELPGSGIWAFPGGDSYGSITAPTSLGSGTAADPNFDPKKPYSFDAEDSFWTHKGAYGGGAIKLVVAGTARIDGKITANGALAGETGASGGSVLITAGTLTGNGVIRANGSDGPGHGNGRGGGGGGRVAVILKGSSGIGTVRLQAYGGEGRWSPPAAAGTVYLETRGDKPGQGLLIVDNAGKVSRTMNEICTSVTDKGKATYSFKRIEIRNRAVLYVGKSVSITAGSVIADNANMVVEGTMLAAKMSGLKDKSVVRPQDEVSRKFGQELSVYTFGKAPTMKEDLLARSFQISVYPYFNKIDVAGDLSTYAYSLDVADVKSAVVKLISNSTGRQLATNKLVFDTKQFAQTSIAVDNLQNGTYVVKITLDNGNSIAPIKFERKELPWEHNTLGITDKVYPPFEPIKVEGNDVRLCCGRTYRMNAFGLFDNVITENREITSGPITVKLETASGPKEFKLSEGKFTSVKENAVEFVGVADSGVVTVRTKSTVEFDGCAKIEMDIIPGATSEEIQKMWIDIPLKDSEVPLFHYCQNNGLRWNYAGKTPRGGKIEWESAAEWKDRRPPVWWVTPGSEGKNDGIIWNSTNQRNVLLWNETPFVPYIWLGGAERGLAWFADNDKGWIPNTGQPGQFIVRDGDKVVMRYYIINKPVTLKEQHHLVFGLQASPTKPMMPDFRRVDRFALWGYMTPPFGRFCCSKFPIDHDFSLLDKAIENGNKTRAGEKVSVQFAYDKVEELKAKGWPESMTADNWVRFWITNSWNNIAVKGPYNSIYYEEHWTEPGQSDVDDFGNEWGARRYLGYWPIREKNRVVYDSPAAADSGLTGRFLTGTYTQSMVDFSVYYGNELMKRGIGLYFDNTYPHMSSNPSISDAYMADNGKIQYANFFWNQREYYKRIWNIMCAYNEQHPDAPVYFSHHMSNTMILPWNTWTTKNLDNENAFTDVARHIRPAVFPYDWLLTESVGRQVGTPGRTHWNISGYDGTKRREWGMRTVHDLGPWGEFTFDKPFMDFGYGKEDVEVINYWTENPKVNVSNEEVKWILLSRRENPTTCLVLQSYEFDPASTKVKVNGVGAWMNAETGKMIPMNADGAISVTFSEGYGTVILVGAAEQSGLSEWKLVPDMIAK